MTHWHWPHVCNFIFTMLITIINRGYTINKIFHTNYIGNKYCGCQHTLCNIQGPRNNDDLSSLKFAHISQAIILSCRVSCALSKGTKIASEPCNVWMQWPLIKWYRLHMQEPPLHQSFMFLLYFLRMSKGKEWAWGVFFESHSPMDAGPPQGNDSIFHGIQAKP